MDTSISLEILDRFPFMEIATSLVQYYLDKQKEKFFHQLQDLLATAWKEGNKGGNQFFDVITQGFVADFKAQYRARKQLKGGIDAIWGVEYSVENPFRNVIVIETRYHLKEKTFRFMLIQDQEGKENKVYDLIALVPQLRDNFKTALKKYIEFILSNNTINQLLQSETKAFNDRYLSILSELNTVDNLGFYKWIFPEEARVWDKVFEIACSRPKISALDKPLN